MSTSFPTICLQCLLGISRHIDAKISRSGRHSDQVAHWVRKTALNLQMSEEAIETLFWAAQVHDVGKIGIPDAILAKKRPLSQKEWKLMRMHPTIGANLIGSIEPVAHLAPAVYAHQEKYDGSGYPEGLRGRDIPLAARVLAVVDAYEAMTSSRVYRPAFSHTHAVDELKRLSGKQFDPEIVEVFLGTLGGHG